MIRYLFSNFYASIMNDTSMEVPNVETSGKKSILSGEGPHSFLISVGDWGTIKNEDGSVMCIVNDIINTSKKTLLFVIKIDPAKKQTAPHTVTKSMIQLTKSMIQLDKWYRQQTCNLAKIEIAKKVYDVYADNLQLVFPSTGKTMKDSETVKVNEFGIL